MKPLNFEVLEKPGQSTERLIKRFIKKTSKNKIVQMCLDKMYFKSDSSKGRNKRARKKYIKQKIQKKHESSIN